VEVAFPADDGELAGGVAVVVEEPATRPAAVNALAEP